MTQLDDHALVKKEAVKSGDIISVAFGVFGSLLIGSAFVQPGHSLNGARILGAIGCFSASCIAERFREEHLESLEKAIGFQREIRSAHIRQESNNIAAIEAVKRDVSVFDATPKAQWPIIAERLGLPIPQEPEKKYYDPPIAVAQPQIIIEDPGLGYDPEKEESSAVPKLILAAEVEEWMESIDAPQGLIDEWRHAPGYAIQVEDDQAIILRKDHV